jgi:hypothetical protein
MCQALEFMLKRASHMDAPYSFFRVNEAWQLACYTVVVTIPIFVERITGKQTLCSESSQ